MKKIIGQNFFGQNFFGGVFVASLLYTILLVFYANSFIAIVSSVCANLAWVLFMLCSWNTFSPRGKTLSILFMILMDIAFLLFIYYKVLAL